ncbi:MAG: hypothetical protein KC433_12715 [Anaerolineales bacterium]|nr:hypothetical protein [Anaerolineales bacterium]
MSKSAAGCGASATSVGLAVGDGADVAATVGEAVGIGVEVESETSGSDETSGSAEQLTNNNRQTTSKANRVLNIVLFSLQYIQKVLLNILRLEANKKPNVMPPALPGWLTIGIRCLKKQDAGEGKVLCHW